MEALLQSRIPIAEAIINITRQPSVSIGVIHDGQEALNYFHGVVDVESGQIAKGDTIYCIASLTKAFIVAALDLLVQDGQFSWDSTITSTIPDFKHYADINSEITLRNIRSHRTGLLSLDEITQGLDARNMVSKGDVVKVCSALLIKFRLRANYLYNNALYALAGYLIEHASESCTWGDFLSERLFKDIRMDRTTAFRSVHESDSNIATPYMISTDGSPSKIAPTELSADSMNGASGGVRSTLNNLLKWSRWLMGGFPPNTTSADLSEQPISPMFNRMTIATHESVEDGNYCMGWCQHRTPSRLGLISPNRSLTSPLHGEKSPSVLVSNFYLIPDSKSAIVILSNGTGLSDATDWIAQDLIQAMYGLQPHVNFVDIAKVAATEYLAHFDKNLRIPLEENRLPDSKSPPLQDFLGCYFMDGLDTMSLDVTLDDTGSGELLMVVNKQPDQSWKLWHYHNDVWCHLPKSYDLYLSRGVDRSNWTSFLLSFTRDQQGKVEGLGWKLKEVDVTYTPL
ncbi:beta-lactamase/transpeptidase-like protein [Cadophora sp. DSE1049]|nr:beta-lactamase/transpeptidase-like protein [Cadophora sp. DSE1049]